uniref:SAP domain-containing ribonucleoprotein n=1 Tax=Erpetoichthys calabaricus TaxID=27687 RepID=A0A8C4SCV3_ERPCA
KMAEVVELHKLKLAELKQECIARGLEVKGNKQDLINRLQAYLDTHAEEEVNEEEVLGDDTEVRLVSYGHLYVCSSDLQAAVLSLCVCHFSFSLFPQRLRLRAERFNVPVTADSKKAARAARFGLASTPLTGKSVF